MTFFEQQLDDLDEQLAGLNDDLDDTNEQLAGLKNDLDDTNKQLAGLKDDLDDTKSGIKTLAEGVATLKVSIDQLTNRLNRGPLRKLKDLCRSLIIGAELTTQQKSLWNGTIMHLTEAQRTRGGIALSPSDLRVLAYGGLAQEAGDDASHSVDVVEIAEAVMSSPDDQRPGLENLFRFAFPHPYATASDIVFVVGAADQASALQVAAWQY